MTDVLHMQELAAAHLVHFVMLLQGYLDVVLSARFAHPIPILVPAQEVSFALGVTSAVVCSTSVEFYPLLI